jgi:ribose/xylose/arabinose/galactoside ABC-type transport system permease subunit
MTVGDLKPSDAVLDYAREPRATWRNTARILNSLGPVFGLIFVIAFFTFERYNTFLTWGNFQIILIHTAVVATAALGMTVVIVSGGIDLSVGAAIALCTVCIANLIVAGYPPFIAAAGGVLSCVCVGLIIGTAVTTLDLSPFIVTLGLWGAVRGFAKWCSGDTNVNPPSRMTTTWLFHILNTLRDDQTWMIFPIGVWIMFGLTIVVGLILRYTRFGRHVFAIGSNEQTARLCGVRVEWGKVMIYLFAGLFTGIAGVLEFSHLRIGDPTTADGLELNVIAAVVIGGASLTGGQGGVAGTIVGAMLMTVVQNGCTKMNMATSIQQIVTGLIIVFAAILDSVRHGRIRFLRRST